MVRTLHFINHGMRTFRDISWCTIVRMSEMMFGSLLNLRWCTNWQHGLSEPADIQTLRIELRQKLLTIPFQQHIGMSRQPTTRQLLMPDELLGPATRTPWSSDSTVLTKTNRRPVLGRSSLIRDCFETLPLLDHVWSRSRWTLFVHAWECVALGSILGIGSARPEYWQIPISPICRLFSIYYSLA